MIHVPVRMGGRWVGRVWRYRGTAVETLFFHVWFAAAYLRTWTPLAGGAMLASWWGAWWWYARWSGALGVAAMTAGVTVLGWLVGLRVPAKHRAAMDEWLEAGGPGVPAPGLPP